MPSNSPPLPESRVAVVGAGSIGASFALVFAMAGRSVALQDPDPARRDAAPRTMGERLRDLAEFGLTAESPAVILQRIRMESALSRALDGATYVQECAPEDLDLKRRIFAE